MRYTNFQGTIPITKTLNIRALNQQFEWENPAHF